MIDKYSCDSLAFINLNTPIHVNLPTFAFKPICQILSSAPIILFVFGVEKFQTEVETFDMKLFDVDFVLYNLNRINLGVR